MTATCPTCDKVCQTESGMKNHHAQVHDESLVKVEVECSWCGKVTIERESQVGQFGRHYCSRECYDEAQSERKSGKTLVELVGEEGKEKQRQSLLQYYENNPDAKAGENNPMYGTTRELSEDAIEKIREANLGCTPPSPEWMFDEDLGHFTRSGWEREFGRLLQEGSIDYGYESLEVDYEAGRKYRPDFVIHNQDVIIELKGYLWESEIAVLKAEATMEQYPDWNYIVVGENIPCDMHYTWSERQDLVEWLQAFGGDKE